MKNLIIYYSRRGQNYVNGSIKNLARGNAEVITEFIKDGISADVFEVDTVRLYRREFLRHDGRFGVADFNVYSVAAHRPCGGIDLRDDIVFVDIIVDILVGDGIGGTAGCFIAQDDEERLQRRKARSKPCRSRRQCSLVKIAG